MPATKFVDQAMQLTWYAELLKSDGLYGGASVEDAWCFFLFVHEMGLPELMDIAEVEMGVVCIIHWP